MTLHPQSVAAIALWAQDLSCAAPGFGAAEIDEAREQAREAAAAEPHEEVAEVGDVDAAGVRCRFYRPVTHRGGAILFAHGGGFVFGELDTHDARARRLANRTGLAVLSVGYRLAPEHPFPAAHDDVSAAGRWLAEHAAELGVDPTRLVCLGDSAGGSLALVTALRNPGRYAACVLVYPFVDPRRRGASYHGEDAHGFSDAEAQWYWRAYAGGPDRVAALLDDPGFCPLDASGLEALPPTQVLVAEHDILRDEDLLLAERIAAATGTVETVTYPGMIHGFWGNTALFDAAEESYADTAAFLGRVLG